MSAGRFRISRRRERECRRAMRVYFRLLEKTRHELSGGLAFGIDGRTLAILYPTRAAIMAATLERVSLHAQGRI